MTDEQPTEPILPDSLSPERAVELGNVESVVEPAKKKRGRPPKVQASSQKEGPWESCENLLKGLQVFVDADTGTEHMLRTLYSALRAKFSNLEG